MVGYLFHLPVFLNHIEPGNVLVELYAEGIDGGAQTRIKLEADPVDNKADENRYHAKVISTRPASDFTARIIANYLDVFGSVGR